MMNSGRGYRARTCVCRNQNPMPYQLGESPDETMAPGVGIEPTMSCDDVLTVRCVTTPRTPDLNFAMQSIHENIGAFEEALVGIEGVEPVLCQIKSLVPNRSARFPCLFHFLGTPQSLVRLPVHTRLLELRRRDEGISRGARFSLHVHFLFQKPAWYRNCSTLFHLL